MNNIPIYKILMIENANKEEIYPTGKKSGFPDFGTTDCVGFFYDVNDAIKVLENNSLDIRETVYDAAFILCQYPGLYQSVEKEERMYFVWNEEKQGYEQKEEPVIFKHLAL